MRDYDMELDRAVSTKLTGEPLGGETVETRAVASNSNDASASNQIIIIVHTNSKRKARPGRRKMNNHYFTVIVGKFSAQNQLVPMKTVISLITLTSIIVLADGGHSEGSHANNLVATSRSSSANSFGYLLHNHSLEARGLPGVRHLYRFEQPEGLREQSYMPLRKGPQSADLLIESLISELELERVFDAFSGSMGQVFILFSPFINRHPELDSEMTTNLTGFWSGSPLLRRVHRAKRHLGLEKDDFDHDFEFVDAQTPSKLAANSTRVDKNLTHMRMRSSPTSRSRRPKKSTTSTQNRRHQDQAQQESIQSFERDDEPTTTMQPLTEAPESSDSPADFPENARPSVGDEPQTPASVAGISSDVEQNLHDAVQSMKLTDEPRTAYDDRNPDYAVKASSVGQIATHQAESGQVSRDFQTTRRPRSSTEPKRKFLQMPTNRQQIAIPSPEPEVDRELTPLGGSDSDVVPQVGDHSVDDDNLSVQHDYVARGKSPQKLNRIKSQLDLLDQQLDAHQRELLFEKLINRTKNVAWQQPKATEVQKAYEQDQSEVKYSRSRLPPYGAQMTTILPIGSQGIKRPFPNYPLSKEQDNILGALLAPPQNYHQANENETFRQEAPTYDMNHQRFQSPHTSRQTQTKRNILPERVHFTSQSADQQSGRTIWGPKKSWATNSNGGDQMPKMALSKQGSSERKLQDSGSKRYLDFESAIEQLGTTTYPRFDSNNIDASLGYAQGHPSHSVASFTRPDVPAASQGLYTNNANLATLVGSNYQNGHYNPAHNLLSTLQSLTLSPQTTALNSQLAQASHLVRRQPGATAVNSFIYQRQGIPTYLPLSATNRLGMAYIARPQSQISTKRQMSASGSGTHTRIVKHTKTQSQYDEPASQTGSSSSSLAATNDPIWSDTQNQEEDYQQAPQTIQITAVPNGLGVGNGWNGGWNGWNGVNGWGGFNGRQVLLVNRQPQVGSEWRQWALPIAIILALPLVLGALFVPVFLKSVMFLIQILQMLGLLMPPHQLAGHLASGTHSSSSG